MPSTLRNAHKNLTSDVAALDAAIREGVTRNPKTNQGNGLYGSYRLAHLSEGRFALYSRFASLSYSRSTGLHSKTEKVPFMGTAVALTINIENPDLLSEALTFRGKRHSPFSYVDRINEEEEYLIKLSEVASSFGSRAAASPVRTKVENILGITTTRIVLDLSDVPLITSSFADEVFGKLFTTLGPTTFMNRINIVGTDKLVRQIIDRAISQRMVLGNID